MHPNAYLDNLRDEFTTVGNGLPIIEERRWRTDHQRRSNLWKAMKQYGLS